MKALVLKAYNEFSYEDVPAPEVGAGEVSIAVKACGICGSDVHGMDGSSGRRQPPVIMGHEAAGVIAEVGADVSGWQVGDRVTFDSTVYCGDCWFCRRGEINLCDNRRVLGVSCAEYRRHGAFAEYVAAPARILHRLPDAVSFERAALVEPLSIAMHAVRITPPAPGEAAVVLGTGMIGLLIVQVLRANGGEDIIAVDIEPSKLELALRFGAKHGLDAKANNVVTRIFELTGDRGAGVAFEAAGFNSSVNAAVGCLRKGGALTLVGNLSPTVELPLQAVVTRNLTLRGSCASCGDYPACLDLIAEGRVDVDPLLSATAPLADGAAWFERLYNKEPGLMKVILQP